MIANDLEQKIYSDFYKENDLLPSENQLSESYATTRTTVRQALSVLEENGLIHRRHGYGSIVIAHDKLLFPISGLTSFKELQTSLGFKSETEVIDFEELCVDQKMADRTGFPLGCKVFQVLRRRKIDDKFAILDLDILRADVCGALTKSIAENSIYDYLENSLNLEIAYAQKEITIDFISEQDQRLLDLGSQDHHIVSVKSHVYLSDNTFFQYTESRHQVDKFRFTEVARRQKR